MSQITETINGLWVTAWEVLFPSQEVRENRRAAKKVRRSQAAQRCVAVNSCLRLWLDQPVHPVLGLALGYALFWLFVVGVVLYRC